MEEFELEVNSVADLRVAVYDELNVEDEVVDDRLVVESVVGSIARSAPGIVAARATMVADAVWRHKLTGWDGQVGAIRHYEHAVCNGQSAEVAASFGFPARSVTGSSTAGHDELTECVVTSTDFMPAGVHYRCL